MEFKDIVSGLIFSGIIQILIFIFFFLEKDRIKKKSNLVLFFYLFLVLIQLIGIWFAVHKMVRYFPHILFIYDTAFIFHIPLIYLFLTRLLNTPDIFATKKWLHFAPAIVITLIDIQYLFMNPEVYHKTWLRRELILNPFDNYFAIAQLLFYTVLSIKLLRDFKRKSLNNLSVPQQIKLPKIIVYLLLIMTLQWMHTEIHIATKTFCTIKFLKFFRASSFFSMVPIILSYYALSNPKVFIINDQKEKYAGSSLNASQMVKMKESLDLIMQIEKPFLNEKLTIDELSRMMEINKKDLSRVINDIYKVNFFDFINNYRIDEFKRLASSKKIENETILALAFESGFNSKSSFNMVFKKLCNITPSYYIKSLKE